MTDKFCLKWNDFKTSVSNSFSQFRNEDYLHDVTLVSGDHKKISAHKLVLSACSEYFKDIFKNNHHPHPLICLDGVSSEDLRNIMDYMYNGKVQIYQNNLDTFLVVAKRLKLEGLIGGKEEKEEFVTEYNDNGFGIRSVTNAEINSSFQTEMQQLSTHSERKKVIDKTNLLKLDNSFRTEEEKFKETSSSSRHAIETELFTDQEGNMSAGEENVDQKDDEDNTDEQNMETVQLEDLNKMDTKGLDDTSQFKDFIEELFKEDSPRKRIRTVGLREKDPCPTTCPVCEKTYTSKYRMKEHYKQKHTIDEQMCNQCGLKFKNPYLLSQHKSVEHGKLFRCDQCDYTSKQAGNFKLHIAAVHEKKRFYCDQCESCYAGKQGLEHHIRSFHKKMKVKCSECDFESTMKGHLQNHYRKKHLNFRYTCEVCSQEFCDRYNFQVHMMKKHSMDIRRHKVYNKSENLTNQRKKRKV